LKEAVQYRLKPFLHRIMQTFNSFNELATAQQTAPLQSQMSVFNADESEKKKLATLKTQREFLTGAVDKVVQQRDELLRKFADLKTNV